jgi:AraC family transcriptional activator of pobA
MQTLNAEQEIPKYPFEPDEEFNNPMFRIAHNYCNYTYYRKDLLIPHRKDHYMLVFVKEGNSKHWIDMMPYTIKPDTMYFTVPHQIQMKEEPTPSKGTMISFTDDFLSIEENGLLKQLPIIQNLLNAHELILTFEDVAFVEDMLDKIDIEYKAKNNWKNGMLMAYMQVLLIYLSRLYTEQFKSNEAYPDRQLLKKYLAKIDEEYKEIHEVAAYADFLNISAGHLSELVKEQSGKSAITHIHERIVLEAKRLLFHTESSIKEVSFQLGFEDASYFNRFFKRITGNTPMDYRTATREMYH